MIDRISSTAKNCPVCGNIMAVEEILPGKANTSNVVKDPGAEIKKVDLTFYRCGLCGHGAIDNLLSEEFYEDFSVALLGMQAENTSLINSRSDQFKGIIERLVSYGTETESILEIGSGGGYLLRTALDYYKQALGVEPSRFEAENSKRLGLDVINDFFSPHLKLDRKFSAFISTMVFEHIPDVKETIDYAYSLLIDGGVGMIQVPNAQRTSFGKVYFDIYPQHLHYFTPLSLSKLAADAGFEIISLIESENRNYLELYIRKTRIESSFKEKLQRDQASFDKMMKEHAYAAIWGASYAARSCAYIIDQSRIRHIFDMSSIKVGNYINDFPLKIEFPTIETVQRCDLIIVMANEYTAEILDKLKSKFDYRGDVAYFDDFCELQYKSGR